MVKVGHAGIANSHRRTRSAWREFHFLFHHILAAINPPLLLQAVLQSWNQVAAALSEPSRKRRP
jgi:uncharacterized membrane protein YozB (DUF420 family)